MPSTFGTDQVFCAKRLEKARKKQNSIGER